MMLVLFLSAVLCTSALTLLSDKKILRLVPFTEFYMLSLIAVAVFCGFNYHQDAPYTLHLLDFNQINLTLSLQYDALTRLMMIFILVIGYFIYRYAQNYLESDSTRLRFLSQLNLVLFSVLLLVMAANILTAFVAWQFIGIALYVLLNHYHHDPEANRAAKKKFVLNSVGDSTFLLAIIIAYQTQSAASFAAIQASPHAAMICSLLFISVITKCAQFPFHIWLVDTMEAPTPVSALMHAGVINAGGILLTRVSGTLVQYHSLTYLILCVGLLSAVLSTHWVKHQSDVKKKLAYSTMGQMGYMLMQCGLGTFPAAVFHLISHGFYKASLFLNAGETLTPPKATPMLPLTAWRVSKAFIIALVMLLLGLALFTTQMQHVPILLHGFIMLTLATLVLKTDRITTIQWPVRITFYSMIAGAFYAYLFVLQAFSQVLSGYEYVNAIPIAVQLPLLAFVCGLQMYAWAKDGSEPVQHGCFKDSTESFLRRLVLRPLRMAGDIVNIPNCRSVVTVIYWSALLFAVALLGYSLLRYGLVFEGHAQVRAGLILVCLLISVYALILANRCLSIKSLLLYLGLFELALGNIALFDINANIIKIGFYHFFTVSTVLLMLVLLARRQARGVYTAPYNNRLPTRVFYLVVGLLLLIGIPGTSSFIAEFYLLHALVISNPVFVFLYIVAMILLAIVIMHSLQLYAFSKKHFDLLLRPVAKLEHVIFSSIILFNIVTGIWPELLLDWL